MALETIVPAAMFCVFILFGLLILVGSVLGVTQSKQAVMEAAAWPSAFGKIVAKEVVTRTDSFSQLSGSRGIRIGPGGVDIGRTGNDFTYFVPRVTYTYVVDGVSYTGHTITLGGGDRAYSESGAEEMLLAWTVGSDVEVRYDAKDPSKGFLQLPPPERTENNALVGAGVGCAFFGGGLLALIIFLSS